MADQPTYEELLKRVAILEGRLKQTENADLFLKKPSLP
jgi:hypothetical protein